MFSALAQISKHSVDLAEMVVESEIFPSVLTSLKDQDEYVRKNVATLMREIARHTPEVGYRMTLTSTLTLTPTLTLTLTPTCCVYSWLSSS